MVKKEKKVSIIGIVRGKRTKSFSLESRNFSLEMISLESRKRAEERKRAGNKEHCEWLENNINSMVDIKAMI